MRRDIKRAPRRLFVVCLAFVSAFGLRASLISPNLGEKKNQRQRNRGSREEERAPMSNVEKGRHSSPAPSRSSLSKWRRSGMRFINAAVWRVPRNVPSTSSINQFSRIKKKNIPRFTVSEQNAREMDSNRRLWQSNGSRQSVHQVRHLPHRAVAGEGQGK